MQVFDWDSEKCLEFVVFGLCLGFAKGDFLITFGFFVLGFTVFLYFFICFVFVLAL